MNVSTFLVTAGLLVAGSAADAMSVDPAALARYDNSYVQCEATFPAMRGHRDEAYLSLWRARADAGRRAELAAVRKGAAYRAERNRLLGTSAKAAAVPASSPIQQECQVLWAEAQKYIKAKP